MNYLFPVTAIHRDGKTRVLNNVAEVIDFVDTLPRKSRFEAARVGTEWVDYETRWGLLRYEKAEIQNDWILRDDRGRKVDHKEFPRPERAHYRRCPDMKYEFRNGPVPGYGSFRGCHKYDAPRKRHGGKGVLGRGEMHRREFQEDMGLPRIRRHFYMN